MLLTFVTNEETEAPKDWLATWPADGGAWKSGVLLTLSSDIPDSPEGSKQDSRKYFKGTQQRELMTEKWLPGWWKSWEAEGRREK